MTSPKTSDFGYDDPTQYDHRADANAAAYGEIAALGLSAGFLSASLTLHLVRADGLAAMTPTVVVPASPMTVVPEGPVVQSDSTTVTAAPTGASRVPATSSVTIAQPPPPTMTNPSEPPAGATRDDAG